MKKRILTFFLVLTVGIGTMCASNTQVGGIWYNFDSSTKTASVTYKGSNVGTMAYSGDIIIPPSVTYAGVTYSVTSIGSHAFYICANLTSVTIPNSVTSIEDMAFQNCESLTSITIPNSVTSIGNSAFRMCHALSSVILGNSIIDIGDHAFSNCSVLQFVILPNSLKTIGERAFFSCEGLLHVTLGNSIVSIGKEAFIGCDALSSIMVEGVQPPILATGGNGCFPTTASIYVPCSTLTAYRTAWATYASRIKYTPLPYTITITASEYGSVGISKPKEYTICDEQPYYHILTATPKSGNHFIQWSDGNTDNPRTIELTQDTIFSAEYAINYYSLSVSCDSDKGSVNPAMGEYAHASEVEISALPRQGYMFRKWSDGNTDNPRTLSMTQNTELSAIFVTEIPLKSISVNGEPIAIADTMIFYDEHDDSYVPQIEVIATSASATASVAQLNKENYGWNATIQIKEANELKKEYNLLIYNNVEIQKTRITLTDGGRTNFSLSYEGDSIGSFIGTTLHQYYNVDQHSTFIGFTGYKLGNRPSYIGMTFSSNTLRNGDIVSVLITQESNLGDGDLFFYSDEGITPITTIHDVYTPGLYSFVLGSEAPQLSAIYLYRKDLEMNPHVAYLEITRVRPNFIQYNPEHGYVTIDFSGNSLIVNAYPNPGYHFTQWSDGNTDNPRTIVLPQDTTLTTEFAHNPVVTYVCNAQMGSVSGPTMTATGIAAEDITFYAIPKYGYHFVQWSDGNIDNPRTIWLSKDTTFIAEFAIDKNGTCGDNNALTWTYETDKKTLTITGNGALYNNYTFGIEAPTQMQELVIGNEVTSIGDSAFYGMSSINHLIIGGSVAAIGNYAFAECRNFDDITCLATIVPVINGTTFANVGNKQYIYLFVPENRERAFHRDTYWGEFDIQVQQAEETTIATNDVQVEPQDNAATLTWPTSGEATSYTIEITKDGVLFCTLIFNANGQLTGIAFAPSRNGTPHAPAATKTANGLQFTVTGLNSNTQYGYSVTAKDANDQPVATYSGEFTTTGEGTATGVEEISSSIQGGDGGRLILREGQIFILRGKKVYTLQGQEVK